LLGGGKIHLQELALGAIVIFGISIIFYEEPNAALIRTYDYAGIQMTNYQLGLIVALISAALSAPFSLLNAKLVAAYPHPVQITFWEMAFAFFALFIVDLLFGSHNPMTLWATDQSDILYLFLLSLLCTAYPFIKSVELLKRLSPFTVMLAINLEPVYGILLAALLFGAEESMTTQFYFGVIIILGTVITNGIIKAQKRKSLS
jgi:drug/metabolite transporter (DMT)-like permease